MSDQEGGKEGKMRRTEQTKEKETNVNEYICTKTALKKKKKKSFLKKMGSSSHFLSPFKALYEEFYKHSPSVLTANF